MLLPNGIGTDPTRLSVFTTIRVGDILVHLFLRQEEQYNENRSMERWDGTKPCRSEARMKQTLI